VRLLLDTHLLLWAVASSKRLPPVVRDLLEDSSNDAYFSAASIWEIAGPAIEVTAGLRADEPLACGGVAFQEAQ
jgi:PIN domain nuclease of toxin-antitoxin system